MNPDLSAYLTAAEEALRRPSVNGNHGYHGPVHVGVDLGTAYTTLFVLDEDYQPLIGTYRFAEVV
ncbi:MAG: ethanolamine utilization protein EutJ, partial [Anaerolineales bacterium]